MVSSMYERNRQEFVVSRAAILELLNECYRMHFFELPNWFGGSQSVGLFEDGTVRAYETIVSHGSYTTISVTIGDYEKSVTYSAGSPRSFLLRLERAIRERWAEAKASD